ncbi:MAG: hypothetical protein ACYDHW_16845 [Syntrophorhabdaceae bacterium]
MESNKSDFWVKMAERWPSAIVARTEVSKFTGGLISVKYQANLDSKGLGPAMWVRIGRKIAYPVSEYVDWLRRRSTVPPVSHQAQFKEAA